MSEIEEIALNQTLISEEVRTLWTNFKKDGKSRYSVKYFTDRLEQLEQYWIDFQINNGHLEELRKTNPTHDYFTRKYFSQFEARYLDIKATLKAKLDDFKKTTQLPSLPSRTDADIQAIQSSSRSTSEGTRKSADNMKCPARFNKLNFIKNNFVRVIDNLDLTQNTVYLGFKLGQLKECWTRLAAMNEEIMSSLEEADYEQEYVSSNEFIDLEQMYQDAYIQIKEAEQRQQQLEGVTPQAPAQREIKLPTISIPVFSGRYDEWIPFWELFERLVHNNGSLNDVERIQYLKGNLRGEAARIVNHLSPTSSNYATAVELLTKRFQNPAALVKNYIQKLLTLKPVRNESSFDLKTILDTSKEILYGINNLGVDVSSWDPLVIELLYPKLDPESRKLYQQARGTSTEIPRLSEFFDFIEGRFRGLEGSREFNREHQSQPTKTTSTKNHVTTFTQSKCVVCSESHQLFNCKRFLSMKPKNRMEVVQRSKLCFNCLRDGHSARECLTKKGCKICMQQHNSLLHFPRGENAAVLVEEGRTSEDATTTARVTTTCHTNRMVLLATAMVNICVGGQAKLVRALIDQGSQSCFVTEKLARQIKVPLVKYESKINGINGHATQIIAACHLTLQSIHDVKINLDVEALVMPVITSRLPLEQFTPNQWPHIQGLKLADPWYEQPKEIELLIGSDILPQLLTHGLIKGPANTPMAQNTRFGWILSGPVITTPTPRKQVQVDKLTSCISVCGEDEGLKKFWELEEVPTARIKSAEDEMCEKHYHMTHRRDETGRYTVKLPLLKDRMVLGDSRKMALKRFFMLEQRFAKNENLRNEYSKFIQEYISLGHMEEIEEGYTGKSYYLPRSSGLAGTFKRPIAKVCLLPIEDNIRKPEDGGVQKLKQPSETFPSSRPGRHLKDGKQKSTTPSSNFSIALVILSLLVSVVPGSTNYTITHPDIGLFVEQIGTTKIQRGVLRTSIRFPIEDIMRDQANMNNTRDQFTTLCNKAKSVTKESQCDELRHHIEEEWNNVFSVFNRLQVTPIRRQKRGLLGTVLYSIFGVNDEVYHDIEDLDNNQKELIKSTKTNTKIMLSTICSVNETEARINKKINNFTTKLNAGLEEINKMESWYTLVDENKINLHVTNAYLIALSYIREIETKYNKLLNAYLKRTHLFEFLPHKSVEEVINKCAEKLGPEMEVLPDPMDKLEMSSTSTEILVTGYFTISDANEYELVKTNTVPEQIDEHTFREVQIKQTVLGVNYNLQRYFEISLEDINKAPTLNGKTFILRPSIFHSIGQSEDCIVQQLYKKLSFKRCTTRKLRLTHTMWKELWTHNTWMFITPRETTVFIICGTNREEVILNITGIIHVTPDCVIQSKFVRLEAKLFKETRIVVHFSKSVATINTSVSTQAPVYFTNETVIPLNTDLMEVSIFNHREASEALNRIHEHNWKTIKQHQFWTIGFCSVFTVAVIIICVLAVILKYGNHRVRIDHSANVELRDHKNIPEHRFEITWQTTPEETKC